MVVRADYNPAAAKRLAACIEDALAGRNVFADIHKVPMARDQAEAVILLGSYLGTARPSCKVDAFEGSFWIERQEIRDKYWEAFKPLLKRALTQAKAEGYD